MRGAQHRAPTVTRDATGRALVVPGTVTASGLPATAGSGDSVTAEGVMTPEPAPSRVSARVTATERGRRAASEAQRTACLPRHRLRAGGRERQQQPQAARHHTRAL